MNSTKTALAVVLMVLLVGMCVVGTIRGKFEGMPFGVLMPIFFVAATYLFGSEIVGKAMTAFSAVAQAQQEQQGSGGEGGAPPPDRP